MISLLLHFCPPRGFMFLWYIPERKRKKEKREQTNNRKHKTKLISHPPYKEEAGTQSKMRHFKEIVSLLMSKRTALMKLGPENRLKENANHLHFFALWQEERCWIWRETSSTNCLDLGNKFKTIKREIINLTE